MTFEVSQTNGSYFVEVTAIINGQQSVRGVPFMSEAISKWHTIWNDGPVIVCTHCKYNTTEIFDWLIATVIKKDE